MNKPYQVSRAEFISWLRSQESTGVRFIYNSKGNDAENPCGSPKKQATYDFYAIADNGRMKLLAYKDHRRTHRIVEDELIHKYNAWAKKARNDAH